ncbi:MAG: hypothetical protein KGI50_04300 [Patescibacteria group bacterium]|nr:hypothetical protein [Patescibacteria group bacterium]MDE2438493.1 hypothetical protein [Patescibacteria group bacterium]
MRTNYNFILGVVMAAVLTAMSPFLVGYHPSFGMFLIFFLVSYPYKVGKNIYGIFGGFATEGNSYALLGIIQAAKYDAIQVCGVSLYQKAGEDASQVFGLSLYQYAGRDAAQMFGISLCQYAGNSVGQFIGISLYQEGAGLDGRAMHRHFYLSTSKV